MALFGTLIIGLFVSTVWFIPVHLSHQETLSTIFSIFVHVTFSWSVSMLLFFQAPQVNSTYNETKDIPDVTSLLISWFIFLFCLFFQLCALSLFALLWQLSLKPLPVLVNHVFILLVKKKNKLCQWQKHSWHHRLCWLHPHHSSVPENYNSLAAIHIYVARKREL